MLMNRICFKVGTIRISVVAHEYAYCEPRKDDAEYTHVEVGLWSKPTPEMAEYADCDIKEDGELTVYPYVPVEVLTRYMNWLINN